MENSVIAGCASTIGSAIETADLVKSEILVIKHCLKGSNFFMHSKCVFVAQAGLLMGMAIVTPVMAQTTVTAFTDVAVIPMDSERVLTNQTVVVRGDRITALGPTASTPVPVGAVRVRGKGKFLLPGLGDMHVHFADFDETWGGFTLNTTVSLATMLSTFVVNGITTVRDMHSGPPLNGGDPWMPQLLQRIVKEKLIAPRIYTAGDPDESSPEAAAKSVETLKAAGYNFVKLYGRERPLYDSIIAAARRVGLPVVGHVPNHIGIPAVLGDHWLSIEHLIGYPQYANLVSGAGPKADDPTEVSAATLNVMVSATRQAGVWNCPTLAATRIFDSISSPIPSVWQAPKFFPVLAKALYDGGAGVLLGSDAAFMENVPMPNGGMSTHHELQELVTAAGFTTYQALQTGTVNVARFLDTEDSTGTVAVGKRADLVLLEANPLVDIHNATAVAGVMLGGRWLPKAELDRLPGAKLGR